MKESRLWFWFIASGLVMIILLAIHMSIMHMSFLMAKLGLGSEDVLNSASVLFRSRMPFHVLVYILLLGTGLFHGLYGLRGIVYELPIGEVLKKTGDILILLAGFSLFLFGAYAIYLGFVI